MKKSLLALAVLGAFAGAASAQSSVTMYGRVDLSVGKAQGTASKGMFNGSGSRLGVRGIEDLGGGLKALFNIETRFDADTGAAQNFNVCGLTYNGSQTPPAGDSVCSNNRFWGARSIVGLQGGFGEVTLGREYTTSFLGSQLIADPWGWDTVVSANTIAITGLGGIAKVRNDSAVTYKIGFDGFAFGAQIAEATDTINNLRKKPFNMNLRYGAGPILVAFGYEVTGRETTKKEKMWSLNGSYDFGVVKVGGFYGKGDALTGQQHKGFMINATAPIGAGELRAMIGRLKAGNTTVNSSLGLGYHYSLSKRTTIYGDFTRNSKLASDKAGFDVGIKHNF